MFSGSERGSSLSLVPSTSQDLVPEGTGPLTLPTVQSVWTRHPHFCWYEVARNDALSGVVLNQGQKCGWRQSRLEAEERLSNIEHVADIQAGSTRPQFVVFDRLALTYSED